MRESWRRTGLRALLLGVAAVAVVIGSLSIDQTVTDRAEAQHLGFGYPVHFVWSDIASDPYYAQEMTPPYAMNFSPWEIPFEGSWPAFGVSWGLVYALMLAGWLLLRAAKPHGFMRRAHRANV